MSQEALDAEIAVLGAMMTHASAKSEAAEAGLSRRDFYRPTNARIYSILEESAELLSPIIVIDILEKEGAFPSDDRQHRADVLAMTDYACLVSQVRRYASIIRDAAALRRLAQAGRHILQLAESTEGEVGDRLSQAEDIITETVQESAGGEIDALGPSMLPALQKIGEDSRAGRGITVISTGFRRLDDVLIGLRPEKLVVLAARPGQGKSTLATNIIQNVAEAKVPVALFSLEMSSLEIGKKLLAAIAGINVRHLVDLRTPLPANELAAIQKAYKKLASLPIYVSDHGNTTMADVRAKARALKQTQNLGLLVIDYLQLLVNGDPEHRQAEVAATTRAMKMLSRELGIPILLLSQLNRANEKRQEKRPVLSDLRDSGAIEQDADQVVFIHRPELYELNSDKAGVAELIVAKNRDGELGFVNLTFVGRKSRFLEVAAVPDDTPAAEEEVQAFGIGG